MAFYLDTSAAVKLVVPEPATRLLSTWARTHAESLIPSDLLRTELLRALAGAELLHLTDWQATRSNA